MLPRALKLMVAALVAALPLRAQETDGNYSLRPGDRVTVEVFTAAGQRVEVVSGERILDRDGNAYLPYIDNVHLAGLDEVACRQLLVERYGHFYDDPVVNVKVQLRVNVTGAVGKPGQYFLDPTATLIDALSNAGGAGSEVAVATNQVEADPGHVRLVRDGKTMLLDLRPDNVTDEVIHMRIRSGDWIHVPPRPRSRIRDEITFWGSVTTFITSIAVLIIYINRGG
jgi:protein involved in polysaccharide export with SLBB domain